MLKKILVVSVLLLVVISCNRLPENSLVSKKTVEIPTLDGVADPIWDKTKDLTIDVKVPSYSEFDEVYHDKEYQVKIKSLYTDSDIYFLYQWTGDDRESMERETWYFNDDLKKWKQKPKKNSDDYSLPVYEDKFAVIWNIDNSILNFNETGCLVLCHGEFKHTNSEGEIGDIWHWKLDRTGPVNQLDDKWLTYSKTNGRKADEGSGAYKSNKQTLEDSNGEEVTVPLYWIPGKEDYHWILKGDKSAKKIVSITDDHNLLDEDGTIVPTNVFIPSLYNIQPATGSRGDVEVYHNYENGLWTLEVKRAISTEHKDDVDFTNSKDIYYFSVAVFNEAAIAHAYPGVTGTSYPLYFR